MSVELWYQGTDLLPGGFRSTFATADEAMAQAEADVRSGREPGPDRIVSEDGSVIDRKAIQDAANPPAPPAASA